MGSLSDVPRGEAQHDAGGSIHAGHAHLDLTSAREGTARRGTMLDVAAPIKQRLGERYFPSSRPFRQLRLFHR
jgi:hypothetical protein